MKDIIAAQQVQRRPGYAAMASFGDTPDGRRVPLQAGSGSTDTRFSAGSSLLSSAMKFQGVPENSFIADQHPPKRKKNQLLEKIYNSHKTDSLSFLRQFLPDCQKPSQEKPRQEKPRKEKPRQEKPCKGQYAASGYNAPIWQDLSSIASTPSIINSPSGAGRPSVERSPSVTSSPSVAKRVFTWSNFILLGMFLCLAAGSLMHISYIPDPEPPEDARAQESFGARNEDALAHNGDEIPLDLTESFAWQNYTVRSGDTVEGIAKRFGLSLDAVIASNNLRNVRSLRAGERIRIPNMDGIPYTVKSGDSYTGIAASQGVPLEAILDANEIQSEDIRSGTVLFIPGAKMDKTALRQALGSLFIWPLTGKQSSGFGWRNDPFSGVRSFHAGLDISVPMGSAVKASTDGRVSSTGYNAVYGNFLIISHGNDYQTMYAHLSRILVKNGAYVTQGTIIARSGNSGRSTGPHLHFGVYKNKRAINPLEVVNK